MNKKEKIIYIIFSVFCFFAIFCCMANVVVKSEHNWDKQKAIEMQHTKEETTEYINNLPNDCLHPTDYSSKTYDIGYYQGKLGVESYYNLSYANGDCIINAMRSAGYSEKDYPCWLREDGVWMLGDYVMCAAVDYKYGTIIPTSLGDGIVCDIMPDSEIHLESLGISGRHVLDVYTDWE